jgi:hypothetical protein
MQFLLFIILLVFCYQFYQADLRALGRGGSKQRNAGGRVPIVPNKEPVMRPVKITCGLSVRVNVPMENGTVRPSSRKYAIRQAIRVPVRVANKDSCIKDTSKANLVYPID